MGGHLLEKWGLPEKRLSRIEFDTLSKKVLNIFAYWLPYGTRVQEIAFFRSKESFGDFDVIIEIPDKVVDSSFWVWLIKSAFGKETTPYHNHNIYSFPVNGFQVDVITHSSEVYETARTYYAYESGNFMGRVANALGMKYGHNGLYLNIPLSYFSPELPDHEFREILITREPRSIFFFLGFDYDRFILGFQDFQEMSQWVADSKFFDPKVFDFETLNHQNRTRNRKRPVYAAFVEWCKTQPARQKLLGKKEVRELMISIHPEVQQNLEIVRGEVSKVAERKAKYNGKIVARVRGIEKEELGKFLGAFKKSFENFNFWLDTKTAEEVEAAIKEFKLCLRLENEYHRKPVPSRDERRGDQNSRG
jgi:hypothetical protein